MSLDLPIALGDLNALLKLPASELRMRASVPALLDSYFALPVARVKAAEADLTIANVAMDVISILVNAGIALRPHIAGGVQHLSTESKHFDTHFKIAPKARMKEPQFEAFAVVRPSYTDVSRYLDASRNTTRWRSRLPEIKNSKDVVIETPLTSGRILTNS